MINWHDFFQVLLVRLFQLKLERMFPSDTDTIVLKWILIFLFVNWYGSSLMTITYKESCNSSWMHVVTSFMSLPLNLRVISASYV